MSVTVENGLFDVGGHDLTLIVTIDRRVGLPSPAGRGDGDEFFSVVRKSWFAWFSGEVQLIILVTTNLRQSNPVDDLPRVLKRSSPVLK